VKKYFISILFILSSCAYPDIDSIPDFKDMNITDEDLMELCKINNSDNEQIQKCFEEYINNNNSE